MLVRAPVRGVHRKSSNGVRGVVREIEMGQPGRVADAESRLFHYYVHERLRAEGLHGEELSGAVKASEANKIGQLTGAKLLISGSVIQVDKKTYLVARIVGTETSRILGVPATDSAAYRVSSPIYHTKGLADPLLIVHGLVDDNVQFQDAARLIQKLIEEGKHFEVMVYPTEPHTIQTEVSRRDYVHRAVDFFDRNLLGPKP